MAGLLVKGLRVISRAARQTASLGLLFVAVRFAWLAGGDVMQAWAADTEALGSGDRGESSDSLTDEKPGPLDGLSDSMKNSQHRPDLEELKDELDGGGNEGVLAPPKDEATAAPRRILVDLGAERSEVFVNGRAVGRVPYVGQITCREAEKITIEVLPPTGAPIRRKATCHGAIILAR